MLLGWRDVDRIWARIRTILNVTRLQISKRSKPIKQGLIVAPYGSSRKFLCSRHGRIVTGLRYFRADAGFGVAIGCVEADMAEPPTDDVELNTRLEQLSCR